MENATNFNHPLSVLNTTTAVGQNGNLPYSFPVSTIVTVTVCSFGIVANVLVIFTIVFSSLRNYVFMNLIMSLAIFDSMYLIFIINLQRGLFGQLFIRPSLLHCRLNVIFLYTSGMLSSWVTVLISLERYIAICHPFKVHIYCTNKHTYLAIMALIVITSTCCTPFFYSCSVSLLDGMPLCKSHGENAQYDIIIVISIALTLYSFVPFLLITILNVLMVRRIQFQKAFRSQRQQSRETSSAYNSSLIVMMVCVCCIFAVTSFPATVLVIVSLSYKFNSVGLSSLEYDGWLFRMTYMLDDINHGINFFLYCLTGSIFRFAFYNLFKCREKKSERNSFQQGIATTENLP